MTKITMTACAGLALMAGCATSLPTESEEALQQQISQLRAENAQLRVNGTTGGQQDRNAQATGQAFVPVMSPAVYAAQLYAPPAGCGKDYLRPIKNNTDWFVQLFADGQPLSLAGATSGYPYLPPDTWAYVCFSTAGLHTVSGVAYSQNLGTLQRIEGEDGKFSVEMTVGQSEGELRFTKAHFILD